MIVSQLGQKPKLGGGTRILTDHSFSYSLHVSSLYIHVLLSSILLLLVLFLFSKPKIPKIFLLFLFALFGLMRVVVFILFFISSGSFTFVFLIFELQFKNPKIFSFLFASSLLCFKIENTKNICCSSWFFIVLFRFDSRL